MTLYRDLCALIRAYTDLTNARAEYVRTPDPEPLEPQPEGSHAQVERAPSVDTDELHGNVRPVGHTVGFTGRLDRP